MLTADELGAAFGRERIVHAAVGGGTLCRRLLLDLSRLAGFRAGAALEARNGIRAGRAGGRGWWYQKRMTEANEQEANEQEQKRP